MNEHADPAAMEAVTKLQKAYDEYSAALMAVLGLGNTGIPALTAALNNKHATPIAKALGWLLRSTADEPAIARLLDWVVVQCPMYTEVVEALTKAGVKIIPQLMDRLQTAAAKNDSDDLLNLLDVATRLPEAGWATLFPAIHKLLEHDSPPIRETAADAFGRIGLPHGRMAVHTLQELAANDPADHVRVSAADALLRLGVESELAALNGPGSQNLHARG